ncbi:LysR family transcriptional regulator [Jatrophihabitans telluris]|uniref:LysR family transcriptional regulator n=1 Tax=Jatrophihabitans telluris TaxID=2038343 RepID=A0ABY4QU35_9ACTN|nr:LysR family transcriptional regulator [Jatrophihabitans telluris]UQX86948.1 LysR family transcriptional regulator [Jatrophihabitans telluris]
MLDVRKLIMLRAVAAEGSIAAAARELRYTRSAVSQQLSALESEAGAALVDRVGNRITLTPAGITLVEHTERILVELRAAEATLAGDDLEVSGLLRVGVPFGEGPRIMSKALTEVRRRFPRIEIRLVATTDSTGAGEVSRGMLDMAIISRFGVARGRHTEGLREWVLSHDPLRLCVPSSHPLADLELCSAADLVDEAWIMLPSSPLGQLTTTLCAMAGFEPQVAATVNDVGTAIGLVGIGWGITIAPEFTPADSKLRIARIPMSNLDTVRHSVLIVRDGEHLSPRIAAAIAAVRAVSAVRRAAPEPD